VKSEPQSEEKEEAPAYSTSSTSSTSQVEADEDLLEREYWDIVETGEGRVEVEYASDLETQAYGSGFPVSSDGALVWAGNQSPSTITNRREEE
jgi:hypothetical protein